MLSGCGCINPRRKASFHSPADWPATALRQSSAQSSDSSGSNARTSIGAKRFHVITAEKSPCKRMINE